MRRSTQHSAIPLALLLMLGLSLFGAADAATLRFSPPDHPGPELQISAEQESTSLECQPEVRSSRGRPVLLLPATTATPATNFSWNYERALTRSRIAWCALTIPSLGLGDIQTSAEYVVAAIRRVHRMSGKKIDLLGHSQGGMVGRWALRFWPDTRAMVDDYVSLAGANHGGNVLIDARCARTCAPSLWQLRQGSQFIEALNSGQEAFPGVSYTDIYSYTDELVASGYPTVSTALSGGGGRIRNVALQEICPGHVADHYLIGTSDPVGWVLALDALTHDGPAEPGRVDRSVCSQQFMPGVDPVTFARDFGNLVLGTHRVFTAPAVSAEPPLRSYTRAPHVWRTR